MTTHHTNSPALILEARPLTAHHFSAFGTVIGLTDPSLPSQSINQGNALRYDLLPDLQLTSQGGWPMLALFRAQARQFPLAVTEVECHALGSQSFVPLGTQRFVVVVAAAGPAPKAEDLQAFVTDGRQGIVLAPGTWHHALLAVEGGDFAVIERRAEALDCRCEAINAPLQVSLPADLA